MQLQQERLTKNLHLVSLGLHPTHTSPLADFNLYLFTVINHNHKLFLCFSLTSVSFQQIIKPEDGLRNPQHTHLQEICMPKQNKNSQELVAHNCQGSNSNIFKHSGIIPMSIELYRHHHFLILHIVCLKVCCLLCQMTRIKQQTTTEMLLQN